MPKGGLGFSAMNASTGTALRYADIRRMLEEGGGAKLLDRLDVVSSTGLLVGAATGAPAALALLVRRTRRCVPHTS